MKRIVFLLTVLFFAIPCAAEQASDITAPNITIFYKAANDKGYPLIHSRKDCPFLEGETPTIVNQSEFSNGKYHYCFTCTSSDGVKKTGALINTDDNNNYRSESSGSGSQSTLKIKNNYDPYSSHYSDTYTTSKNRSAKSYKSTSGTSSSTLTNVESPLDNQQTYPSYSRPSYSEPSYTSSPSNHVIYTGPKGGRYHYSKNGKKVYERKKRR